MTHFNRLLVPVFLSLVTMSVQAVTVMECEDDLGNRTFQDRCPPGTTPVNQKQYSVSTPDEGDVSLAVTLYTVPECESCDQLREFLAIRKISITEKNVNDDITLQEELKEKTGGELHVPVLLLGEKVLTGYNRTELLQALADAGYSEEKAGEAEGKEEGESE